MHSFVLQNALLSSDAWCCQRYIQRNTAHISVCRPQRMRHRSKASARMCYYDTHVALHRLLHITGLQNRST